MKKVYVGNMSYKADENDLNELFGEFGEVVSANVIKDKFSGRSKGFGFVEFDTPQQAQAALKLDGQEFMGRALKVNLAKEERSRQDRPHRSGGGFRGGERNFDRRD